MTYLGIPLAEMCNAAFKGVRERILMKNIAYAGALAALLDMDTGIIRALLDGEVLAQAGADGLEPQGDRSRLRLREEHFPCPLPIRLEPMNETADSILIDGNTAAALGCLYAGRDGRRLVSDHAGHVADGGVQGLLPEVPRGAGDEAEPVRDPAGGGRAGRGRHGDWRVVGRRPRVHADRRSRASR